MRVKIDDKLICIPPHISTPWEQVSFMQSDRDPEGYFTLVLHLTDGKVVEVPDLDSTLVEIAFAAHMKFLEKSGSKKEEGAKSPAAFLQNLLGMSPEQISAIPLRFSVGSLPPGIENLESALQHNPQATDSPNMPPEVIEKIAQIARIVMNGDLKNFPKPEPHCNCMHCQVARAIHKLPQVKEHEEEEEISDEELKFREWDISQTSEKLYTVTNPLDQKEQYTVYLGTPVGCTCGTEHCEHIRAVLSS